MEFGLLTLGEVRHDPVSGDRVEPAKRLAQIVELAELTEQMGLDVFAVGEHHLGSYAISSPPVVLAAIAARTSRIKLCTGTTLLPLLDPLRAAEDYGTLQLLSSGRAELMIGTGISAAAYELFGLSVDDREELLIERYGLLRRLWGGGAVTWSGGHRPPLRDVTVVPAVGNVAPMVWHAASSSMGVAQRAAGLGDPLFVDNFLSPIDRTSRLVDTYRALWSRCGHSPDTAVVGAGCALHIGRTSQAARARVDPYLRAFVAERGGRGKALELGELLRGSAITVGSPSEVVERVLTFSERYGHRRQLFALDGGGVPFEVVREQVELLGTEIVPQLRRELG